MSDLYQCSANACTYATNLPKSYRLHESQCAILQQTQVAQEELLRLKRKRKREEAGDRSLAWAHLCQRRLSRNTGLQNNAEAPAEGMVDGQIFTSAANLPCKPPTVNDISPQSKHTLSETAYEPLRQTLGHPTYRPTLGQYRDERDLMPEAPPAPLDDLEPPAALPNPALAQVRKLRWRANPESVPYTTLPDSFGRYRVYPNKPESIPDADCELADITDVRVTSNSLKSAQSRPISDIVAPCPNISAFRIQYWHWNEGDKKSKGARALLVHNVICARDFVSSDVRDINWSVLDKSLAKESSDTPNKSQTSDSIQIRIPPRTPAAAAASVSDPKHYSLVIPSFKHRSLTSTVLDAFSKNDPRFFHYTPYKAMCKDPLSSTVYSTYGEAYESQRMLDAHAAIQRIKLDQPCTLPRCAAMIMVFSDATQLANFGRATAWPIRVAFGNLSKYERCKPNSKNHYEVGYMPSLPNDLQEQLRDLGDGRPVPKALLTHLRCELIHEVWSNLLDDEFLQAWRQGIVINCADGITRRVFPRIFSYSADYPEKVLLATIRGMKSLRPCPRCLTPKAEFPNLGIPEDQQRRRKARRIDSTARNDSVARARSIIFTEGRAVNSKRVELLMKPHSYTPTRNAFSRRLRLLGFDIFESLTVDFLHEFELGVWRSVFQHIVRVLHATGSKSLITFNEWFRLVPSFGDGTIRPFSEDVSDMTRPAARNYEDCIIPVLEGLLPQTYEQQILTLLFTLAQWHALGKLRRHTSASVEALRHTTTRLGHELREFRRYTAETEIYETPKEFTARQKRTRTRARPRAALELDSDCFAEADAAIPAKQRKYFNLETSKLHALGDYPDGIETVGTMDSVSTQTGELLHRKTKRRYARTNGRDYLPQMGEIERIEARLNNIKEELEAREARPPLQASTTLQDEDITTTDSGRSPYQIASSQRNPIPLSTWADRNRSDPAIKEFIPRLKNHLLARLSSQQYQDESTHTAAELTQIDILNDRIYAHHTLKIHYTSYDVRRAQDYINPGTPKRFILVPSDEAQGSKPGAHQFWYARVIGIYHANVSYKGRRSKRMDFLWVRWLGRAFDAPGGWDTCRLDQVGYFPDEEHAHAFDFVDPIDVIRAAHLIPRFVGNRSTQYLNPACSIAADDSLLGDWRNYYVNRFVDRDMFMRFAGMGIGHLSCENTLVQAPGVSTKVLESAYEYTNEPETEPEERVDYSRLAEDEFSDADDAADSTDGDTLVGDVDDEEDDEAMRDEDDDEPSW